MRQWRDVRVYVTRHGYDRILERIGCHPRKVIKVARKAWLGPVPDSRRVWQKMRDHPDVVYRELMGYIFVFRAPETVEWPMLITVLANIHDRRSGKTPARV